MNRGIPGRNERLDGEPNNLAIAPAGAKRADLVTFTIDYVNAGGPMTIPASDYMAAIGVLSNAVRNHATYVRVTRNDDGATIALFMLGGFDRP